jgi:hypothetical protein
MKGGLDAVKEYLLLYINSVLDLVQPTQNKKQYSFWFTQPIMKVLKSASTHNNKQGKGCQEIPFPISTTCERYSFYWTQHGNMCLILKQFHNWVTWRSVLWHLGLPSSGPTCELPHMVAIGGCPSAVQLSYPHDFHQYSLSRVQDLPNTPSVSKYKIF